MEMQLFLREELRQRQRYHESGDDWHRMKLAEELKNEGKEEVVCDVSCVRGTCRIGSRRQMQHLPITDSFIMHPIGRTPEIDQPLIFISVVGIMMMS